MSSITTWLRLEPQSRSADMSAGLQARVYDPLWLLARQWQIGEFRGEDNGSPAVAQWRGESARFTRYAPGALADRATKEGQGFDGRAVPLETLVECEPVRPRTTALERLRFAADAGRHFLRLLDQEALSRSYEDVVLAAYPLPALTEADRRQLDAQSLAFMGVMGTRVPDGRALYAALGASLRPVPPRPPALPPALTIAPADASEVKMAGLAWLQWVDSLFTEPHGRQSAWASERMEYGFSLAARTSTGETVLTASEYFSGHLDWHDFDINPGASLLAIDETSHRPVTRTTIPAPVTYRGMPAARFWEFEDARVDFGAVDAAAQDLARMLFVEFAITYGNDWFVLPIDLDVGSLCRTQSLIVTNTFGERFLIRSSSEAGSPHAAWRMFQLSTRAEVGTTADADASLFMLPHTLTSTLESRALEDVLFLRDEMANLAWAIERIVESAIERPLNRFEQERQHERDARPALSAQTDGVYRLASPTPGNWVPLLPVQSEGGLRLQRAKVLRPDGTQHFVEAQGRLLRPDGSATEGLMMYEEEIPREGVRVARSYQLARWQDGSAHLWIGRRKRIGRGEGSSGLRFDRVVSRGR
jgi:hypothetical protein